MRKVCGIANQMKNELQNTDKTLDVIFSELGLDYQYRGRENFYPLIQKTFYTIKIGNRQYFFAILYYPQKDEFSVLVFDTKTQKLICEV